MWSKVAEEMAIPWRAAEAMHWQLGEADMARRAGVVPFSLSAVSIDAPPQSHQQSTRHSPRHSHSHSHRPPTGAPRDRYQRGPPTLLPTAGPQARPLAARRESSTPRTLHNPMPSNFHPEDHPVLAGIPNLNGNGGGYAGPGGRAMLLPSVAEMTTGVSMAGYSAPAYAVTTGIGGGGGGGGGYPGPMVTRTEIWDSAGRGYDGSGRTWQDGNRRMTPDEGLLAETSRRRQ